LTRSQETAVLLGLGLKTGTSGHMVQDFSLGP